MKRRKKILITILVLLFVGVATYMLTKDNSDSNKTAQTGDAAANNGINYDPPTDKEIKETEQYKQELAAQNSNTKPVTQSPSTQASVIITNIGVQTQNVEASGLISNISEDNGTCTLTLTMGSIQKSVSSAGFVDINKTVCEPLELSRDQLKSGTWQAILSYKSNSSSGSSDTQMVNIP